MANFPGVQQARNLLAFLANSVGDGQGSYSLLLKSEAEVLRQSRDAYLYHEHLEECNEPLYFYQFAERAVAQGLRYLADVDLHAMMPGNYPPEVASVLQMLSPDLIHIEQYMDFLRNRMFRQTLLCGPRGTPNYALRPEQLTAFHIAAPVQPVSPNPDVRSPAQEEFRGHKGVTLKSSDPIVKAAMVHMAKQWPQTCPFDQLLAIAAENAGISLTRVLQISEAASR